MGVVLGIVTVEVYERKILSVEVLSDSVVVGEDCAEVVKVDVVHILDAKIFDHEDKHNRGPFVAPKASCGGGGGIVVACLIEALAE